MFTKILFPFLLIGLFLVGGSSFANAQGRVNRLERMKMALALTPPQVSEIRASLKQHRQAVLPLRQDLRAKNKALRDALNAPEPNPTVVGQIVLARKPLNSQLRALNLKLRGNIIAVLTPEQQQKFKQLRNLRRNPRFKGNTD